MHPAFNTVEETYILMDELVEGKGIIGVRFAKSAKPEGSVFFKTLSDAEATLRQNLADLSVNGFWVGCHSTLYNDLKVILEDINKSRPFCASSTHCSSFSVFDLL